MKNFFPNSRKLDAVDTEAPSLQKWSKMIRLARMAQCSSLTGGKDGAAAAQRTGLNPREPEVIPGHARPCVLLF